MGISAATSMNNNRGGNGQFSPLMRRPNGKLAANLDVIDKKDIRMRFRNSRDPLYIAFDYLDNKPVQQLAVDFVKDSIFDIMNFISFGKM